MRDINSITLSNTTYNNISTLEEVDLAYVPWDNNSMAYAFSNCWNLTGVTNINQNVVNMVSTFWNCRSFINAPTLPNSVTNISSGFRGCHNLVNAPTLPNSVTNISGAFSYCHSLVNAPDIPNGVTDMWGTFDNCHSLVNAPAIPNSVVYMYGTFASCNNLVNAPDMTNAINVVNVSRTFYNCTNLTGDIVIVVENITNAYRCFYATSLDKNVYIPFTYDNSEYTATYNSFIAAGYSTTSRKDGVLLKSLYQDVDLTDYDYTMNGYKAHITEYIGSSENIVSPHL